MNTNKPCKHNRLDYCHECLDALKEAFMDRAKGLMGGAKSPKEVLERVQADLNRENMKRALKKKLKRKKRN